MALPDHGTDPLSLPQLCDHYKPLLVEHFSLLPQLQQLHYGKCSLLGRTQRDLEDRRIYLASTRLISLAEQYQCPDGSSRVLLHSAADCELPADESVRIFGEARLWDTRSVEEGRFLSVRELLITIEQLKTIADPAEIAAELAGLSQRYVPCILVHTFQPIDQEHELLQLQLRTASLQARRRQMQALDAKR